MRVFLAIASMLCLQAAMAPLCFCHGGGDSVSRSPCCHQAPGESDEAPCPHCDHVDELVAPGAVKALAIPEAEETGVSPIVYFEAHGDSAVASPEADGAVRSDGEGPFLWATDRVWSGVFLI